MIVGLGLLPLATGQQAGVRAAVGASGLMLALLASVLLATFVAGGDRFARTG